MPVDEELEDVFGVQDACRLVIDLFAGSEDLSVRVSCGVPATDEKMFVDDVADFAREREKGEDGVVETCHVCCLMNDCDDLCRIEEDEDVKEREGVVAFILDDEHRAVIQGTKK